MEEFDLPQLVVRAQYTLSSLRMAIETDGTQGKCWVLVEGKADYDYYRKVIIGEDTLVTQAGYMNKKGEIKGGFRPVKDIVEAILKDGNTEGIIGIVDADYISFMNPPKNLSTNIFSTDKRDLEMSLWSVPEISAEMYTRLSTEPTLESRKLTLEKLDKCKEICRYMGTIHISDAWHGNKCKHEFKNSQYWDIKTYTFLSDWQDNLFLYYQQECAKIGITYGNDQLDESNAQFNVRSLDFCTIARGHDFLSILSNAMIDTAKYNEDALVNMMILHSTTDQFRRTLLWHSINDWQNANGYTVVI